MRKVPRLGEKTFEQAAGFLRINDGDNPLDRSSVHPEAYPVVERILARVGKGISEVMGQPALLKGLSPADFTDEKFGVPTVRDILTELEKPGRDPRPDFKVARFNEGVSELKDLKPGMQLEGTVTNVAQFGAFVDLGVHQDGLVHVSQLANRFVKDARDNAVTVLGDPSAFGNAVLSRWPVAGVAHADLPEPSRGAPDGRRVLYADKLIEREVDPATASEYASILYPIKNAEAASYGKVDVKKIVARANQVGAFMKITRGGCAAGGTGYGR